MKPVIGIVGGIGSGKSHVARVLASRGGHLIDGDLLGHEALRQPLIAQQVVARFGSDILSSDGTIARKLLGRKVFADRQELNDLEAIVFPHIKQRIREEIEHGQREPRTRFIVLDAAVMLEADWSGVCDHIIFVDVPRPERLRRLREQRGWDEAQLAAREAAQLPLDEKRRRCDAVVDNSGDPASVGTQLDALLDGWLPARTVG